MKQFTVKDFITYNNPCFSCGEKISFKFGYVEDGLAPNSNSFLRPVVGPNSTLLELKTSYNNSLALEINHKTNHITTNSLTALKAYLSTRQLYLSSRCEKCYTSITSQFIEFNFNKGFIKPVGLARELLMVTDETHMYNLQSSFIEEKTILYADRIDVPIPVSPIRIECPLIPLYRVKTRERLINKLRTYLTFL